MKKIAIILSFLILITSVFFLSKESASNKLSIGIKADKILIEKSGRRLILLKGNKVLKQHRIALGRHPRGKKLKQGDGKTLEELLYPLSQSPQQIPSLPAHFLF